jgi:hypothetical protein
MEQNLYQHKFGLIVTITLDFIDKYGVWAECIQETDPLMIASQPRPKTCYKVYACLVKIQ